MKTVLITGGAGNVGSALAIKLLESEEYYVVIVNNPLRGKERKLPVHKNLFLIQTNVNSLSDISAVFGRFNFDYVFHYAATVGVKVTLENPIKVLEDIDGIKNILSLSKNTGVKRVFYSSSSEVYDQPIDKPQEKKTTPYAIVKNVGEAYCKSYYQEFGLEYTIFRFFNTYGLNQSDDFVVPRFVKLAINNEPIYLHGDGLQTRSFCYVDDNAQACFNAIANTTCINSAFDVGSDKEQTILSLAETIIRLTNSKSKIIHLPAASQANNKGFFPDTTTMKELLGRDFVSLETGINHLINHYKSSISK